MVEHHHKHFFFFPGGGVPRGGYTAVGYILFLQEQIKDIIIIKPFDNQTVSLT
jgi:hypothetical protein